MQASLLQDREKLPVKRPSPSPAMDFLSGVDKNYVILLRVADDPNDTSCPQKRGTDPNSPLFYWLQFLL